MDGAEIWFRTRERLRTGLEALEYASGRARWRRERLSSVLRPASIDLQHAQRALVRRDWRAAGNAIRAHFLQRRCRFPIDPNRRDVIRAAILERFPAALPDAERRGDRLIAGYYDVLGYRNIRVPNPEIDWHCDPVHRLNAPPGFWARIPYLDPRCGDHKIIWELNRHQHWLMLGRAAWLTDHPRYEKTFQGQLADWLAANPPLTGVNWSSMLELGFRAISWLWSLHFFLAHDDSADTTWLVDTLLGLHAQLNHIDGHLSRYFSPNTHLLGEGLALYVAGQVLPELSGSNRWENLGREILRQEAHRQVNSDGGHAELSTHYHRYALDFYLLALTIARINDDPCADEFATVTSKLATFCRALAGNNGTLPTIGDDDGGMLFPICGREPADVRDSLSLAAALLNRPDLAVEAPPEEALWMLGGDRARLRGPDASLAPSSHLFADTGYAILRSTDAHAVIDVGRHGFLNGGHAHADALSVVMAVGGRPLLVDPGTSTYTTDPRRRNLYRSTEMHNTLTVDGRSQSIPASPFHWRSTADAQVRLWHSHGDCDVVEADHDGYLPLVHRRAVLRIASDLWFVADHLLGEGDHRVDIRWHFDPAWRIAHTDDGLVCVRHADGTLASIATTGSQLTQGEGGDFGWCAPIYGQHVPSVVANIAHAGRAPLSVVSLISAGASVDRLALRPVAVRTSAADVHHRIGVTGSYAAGRFIALFSTQTSAQVTQGRAVQHIESGGIDFHTDAQIAVLGLSNTLEPTFLTLLGASRAGWTGPNSFQIGPGTSAADLHFDRRAVQGLSNNTPASMIHGLGRPVCAE